MVCPKCGYVLSDLETKCPRCADEHKPAEATPAGKDRAWEEWREQAVAYLVTHGHADEGSAGRALAACSWDVQAALAVLRDGAPIPLPPPSALGGRGDGQARSHTGASVWVIVAVVVGVAVLGCAFLSLVVGASVRNAGQRAKSARKAEDVRAINEACWLYENDTGLVATKVGDVTREPAGAPRGYTGPYLIGNPVDPFTGAEYALCGGTVVGPGDVTTFER
jgi:hypothetical protein